MSLFCDLLLMKLGDEHPVTIDQLKLLEDHFRKLVHWNKRLNLTAIRRVKDIVERHFCESIKLAWSMPLSKLRVIDAGSGAGFPGIPIAIVRPQYFVFLVESDARKAVFLREATLELMNCRVLGRRLEDVTDSADWLVSRAVRIADVLEAAERLADHIGLLTTEESATGAKCCQSFTWERPLPLASGDARVILHGHRCEDKGNEATSQSV